MNRAFLFSAAIAFASFATVAQPQDTETSEVEAPGTPNRAGVITSPLPPLPVVLPYFSPALSHLDEAEVEAMVSAHLESAYGSVTGNE